MPASAEARQNGTRFGRPQSDPAVITDKLAIAAGSRLRGRTAEDAARLVGWSGPRVFQLDESIIQTLYFPGGSKFLPGRSVCAGQTDIRCRACAGQSASVPPSTLTSSRKPKTRCLNKFSKASTTVPGTAATAYSLLAGSGGLTVTYSGKEVSKRRLAEPL